jgi:hypothetical protein
MGTDTHEGQLCPSRERYNGASRLRFCEDAPSAAQTECRGTSAAKSVVHREDPTMTKNRASAILFAMVTVTAGALAPATAHATTDGINTTRAPIARVQPLLADVVVNGAPAAAPAAPVVAAPVAAPAPVVEAPAHTTNATVVEHEQHNYMTTIAVSALMGGVVGVLIGGSLYYLNDNQTHPGRIGYWAAGGVLVGTGVGLTQIVIQESRVERATASNLPTDPAPTLRLALFQKSF